MGGRDHACEVCGRGGLTGTECECLGPRGRSDDPSDKSNPRSSQALAPPSGSAEGSRTGGTAPGCGEAGLRAKIVELRDELYTWGHEEPSVGAAAEEVAQRLDSLLHDTPEEAGRCPTCGSDDPSKMHYLRPSQTFDPAKGPCPDPFHSPDLHTGDEESHKSLAGTDEGENVSPSRDALPAAPSPQHPEQSEGRRWTICGNCEHLLWQHDGRWWHDGEPTCKQDPTHKRIEVVEARELESATAKLFEKQEAARRYREEADAALATIESLTTTIQAALDVPDNTEVGTGVGRERITYVTPRHARAVLIETRKLLRSALADHPPEEEPSDDAVE